MPIFIAALWGALIEVLGTVVGKILVSLGIGYVVFSGVEASLTWAKGFFITSMNGAGPVVAGIAGTMKVGVFVSMVTSAFAVRLLLDGLNSGSIRKMVQK